MRFNNVTIEINIHKLFWINLYVEFEEGFESDFESIGFESDSVFL